MLLPSAEDYVAPEACMRVAVVSDIHSNLAALTAVLADAGSVDAVWCLGDIVGYGPQPNECIEMLRRQPGLVCVPGNHDWAVLAKLDTSEFNHDAQDAVRWTREHLTEENRTYLESLKEQELVLAFTLVHGSPRHPIWEYLTTPQKARENFAQFTTQFCLVGHSHWPIMHVENGDDMPTEDYPAWGTAMELGERRRFINPGSVGQPRDGDRDASYILLDPEHKTIEYRRVAYAVHVTQALMRKAGLPARLIERIAHGW
jgi:predicted phosphodiesterase